jgi:hypothetical protein
MQIEYRDAIWVTVAIAKVAAFRDGDRDTGRGERISQRDHRRKERKCSDDEKERGAHVQLKWEMLLRFLGGQRRTRNE